MAQQQVTDRFHTPLKWWQVILLIVFWPVGLVFLLRWLWAKSSLPVLLKVFVTFAIALVAILALLVTVAIVTPSPALVPVDTATPSPSATGTSQSETPSIEPTPTPSPTSVSPTPTPTPTETAASPAPTPTVTAPAMKTLVIKQYGLSVLYPAGWKVVEVENGKTGAEVMDPKSDARAWLVIDSGEDREGVSAQESLQETVDNITGNGGVVTMKRLCDHSFQVRGVVDKEVRHYFTLIGEKRDYSWDWTYPTSMADQLDPMVELSIDSFTVGGEG